VELSRRSGWFGLPGDQVEIVSFQQSINSFHGVAYFPRRLGAGQLGTNDRARADQPQARLAGSAASRGPAERLGFNQPFPANFRTADVGRFPSLRLAREALVCARFARSLLNGPKRGGSSRVFPCARASASSTIRSPRRDCFGGKRHTGGFGSTAVQQVQCGRSGARRRR